MRKYHQKIIDKLNKKSLTPLELALSTGYAYSGITTRISELRKLGYDIQTKPVEAYKYVLNKRHYNAMQTSKKIIEWIEDKNKFNTTIDLNKLSKDINVPLHEIKDGMSKIFKKYLILQKSNTSVVVYQ